MVKKSKIKQRPPTIIRVLYNTSYKQQQINKVRATSPHHHFLSLHFLSFHLPTLFELPNSLSFPFFVFSTFFLTAVFSPWKPPYTTALAISQTLIPNLFLQSYILSPLCELQLQLHLGKELKFLLFFCLVFLN